MGRQLTKQHFNVLVHEACSHDSELRHEIERAKDYDSFDFALEIAFQQFSRKHLTIREAFGLTERG